MNAENMSGTSVSINEGVAAARTPIEAAWGALRHVYDPELYLDVVSLGLVYDVRQEDQTSISEMAHAAIAESLDNAVAVDVRLVWDPPWNPAMIDTEAAAKLGFRVRR
jgi:metal-sulfur cluster biosynthetic enzyme